MRLMTCVVTFVFVFVLSALSGPFVGTVMAQCSDPIRNPTYGKPASNFVSGCEIYFFGEYLEPVEGPDGTKGFLSEKTDAILQEREDLTCPVEDMLGVHMGFRQILYFQIHPTLRVG